MAGFPQEHVNQVIDKVVEKIKTEEKIKVVSLNKSEANQLKEFWMGFIELELVFDDLVTLNHFCFDYLPSSIEILNKETIDVPRATLTLLLNDMLVNMHKYNMHITNLNAENEVMRQKLEKVNDKTS